MWWIGSCVVFVLHAIPNSVACTSTVHEFKTLSWKKYIKSWQYKAPLTQGVRRTMEMGVDWLQSACSEEKHNLPVSHKLEARKYWNGKTGVEYLEDNFRGKLSLATPWGCDAAVICLESDSQLVCDHNFPLNIATLKLFICLKWNHMFLSM